MLVNDIRREIPSDEVARVQRIDAALAIPRTVYQRTATPQSRVSIRVGPKGAAARMTITF